MTGEFRIAVYAVVACIPRGRVATYGQVAALAGYPGDARQVGNALAALPEDLDVPWHRVINAQGRVSPRKHTGWHQYQQALLEQEDVEFIDGRTSLARFGWDAVRREVRDLPAEVSGPGSTR